MKKKNILVEVKIISISYCPIYHMHVLILKGNTDRFWLPVFLRDEDAGFLQSLYQRNTFAPLIGVRAVLQGVNSSILSVVLHSSKRNPFHAVIEVASGKHGRKEVEVPYVEALAIAIQVHTPILIDRDIMKQAPLVAETEGEKVRNKQKEYLNISIKPKGSLEVLQEKLQEAIQREDYELATYLKEELKILNEANAEKNK